MEVNFDLLFYLDFSLFCRSIFTQNRLEMEISLLQQITGITNLIEYYKFQ